MDDEEAVEHDCEAPERASVIKSLAQIVSEDITKQTLARLPANEIVQFLGGVKLHEQY